MQKEGLGGLFNSRDGKVNILLFFSIILIFVLSIFFVNAVTITQQAPLTLNINASRTVNFTFTVVWSGGGEQISNCSIWTNLTGTWAQTVINGSNGTGGVIYNSSTSQSILNVTLDRDGNFSWSVACLNTSAEDSSGVYNFSTNRTLAVDSVAPAILLDTPFPTSLGGLLNITSNATSPFYVNISDNTTNAVWIILNTQATFGGFFGQYGTVAVANESVNRSMTFDRFVAAHNGRYNISIFDLLNFSSNFTSPGPHGVFFCANDTFGRRTCSEKVDFIIKGMISGDIERQFGTGGNGIQHATGGFRFNGLDIRYGN